jgi:diguanylate cyclase (GGDEF)-like protein/PAS domain S-box-containing protein
MRISSEEQLLGFLYACPVGLIECDAAGEIGMINPHAMQHLLPLAGERDAGNLFIVLEQHAPEIRHIVADFAPPTGRICEGHRITVDLGGGRHGAAPKVLACTVVKLGPDRLMATLTDISAQVAQEQRLRQANAWFASLLDQINDYAVITLANSGEIQTANDAFTRQTGHACDAVLGRCLTDVLGDVPLDGKHGLDEQLALAARDGWHLLEGWQRRVSGERYWCQRLVVARPESDATRISGFSVVLRDVPHRGGATDELRRLLTCDHLTGATNRMHFSHMLEQGRLKWRDARQPLSLVMLDLDHFKLVNDTYGHPVGDVLLCRVAETCAALLPIGATFARLGGEEFGAILPRCDGGRAVELAEAMRQAIAAIDLPIPSGVLRATASFGCATLDEVDGLLDELIALADQRLYAAKREGRNRVHCSRLLVS